MPSTSKSLVRVRPGEQNWTGSFERRGCLLCFLDYSMDDVEGGLEGRAIPLQAFLTVLPPDCASFQSRRTSDSINSEVGTTPERERSSEDREPKVNRILESKKTPVVAFCQKHHVRRLSLFGSQLKGHVNPGSDIDLLVEFDRGNEPGLLGLADMERELSTILGGRTVDLRTPNDLSRYFRDEVIRSAQVQYAR
jgi:predicted nucleotidyltransferase